jgi:hypothetical protein
MLVAVAGLVAWSLSGLVIGAGGSVGRT